MYFSETGDLQALLRWFHDGFELDRPRYLCLVAGDTPHFEKFVADLINQANWFDNVLGRDIGFVLFGGDFVRYRLNNSRSYFGGDRNGLGVSSTVRQPVLLGTIDVSPRRKEVLRATMQASHSIIEHFELQGSDLPCVVLIDSLGRHCVIHIGTAEDVLLVAAFIRDLRKVRGVVSPYEISSSLRSKASRRDLSKALIDTRKEELVLAETEFEARKSFFHAALRDSGISDALVEEYFSSPSETGFWSKLGLSQTQTQPLALAAVQERLALFQQNPMKKIAKSYYKSIGALKKAERAVSQAIADHQRELAEYNLEASRLQSLIALAEAGERAPFSNHRVIFDICEKYRGRFRRQTLFRNLYRWVLPFAGAAKTASSLKGVVKALHEVAEEAAKFGK